MSEYTWKVTGETPRTVFDASGNAVPGVRITAQVSPPGTTVQVDIPKSQYSTQTVAARLAEAAAEHYAVSQLKG